MHPCAGAAPCRPRNADVDQAILHATVQLLGERGFDRFTVLDIAERAGAGLGAIYRRWPSKLDVVVAAIRTLAETAPLAPSGDIEEDLARLLELRVHDLQGCLGAILPGLLSAMHDHADLAALVEKTSVGPVLEQNRSVLATAFSDPTEVDLRAELASAVLVYRLLVTQDLPDGEEIKRSSGAAHPGPTPALPAGDPQAVSERTLASKQGQQRIAGVRSEAPFAATVAIA